MRKSKMWSDSRAIPDKRPNPNYFQDLKSLERRFHVLVQESHDVFEIITLDGTIKYVSPTIERVLGYKPEERIGKKAYELLANEEKMRLGDLINIVIAHPDQVAHGLFKAKSRAGKEITLELDMRNGLSEPTIDGIIINWRKHIPSCHDESHQPAVFLDELTKLPNKTAFKARLESEIAVVQEKGQAVGLMIIDVHRFKYLNSCLGYELGDQLLIEIGKRLQTVLREDVFLCRYSGGQFALMISPINGASECEELSKEVLQLFKVPFQIDHHELDISIKIGISMLPQDAQDIDSLIKAAGMALLQSKTSLHNHLKFYTPDVNYRNNRRFFLRCDMHRALQEDQFKVYYQPLVNLFSQEVLAVEALLRWEHPQCGMISPGEFIPIMEDSGFIVEVGEWLLSEVCRNFKQWQKQGLPFTKVSINYSSIQFADDLLVDKIRCIINKYDFDPRLLIIEITESVLMDNVQKVIADIKSLQKMGILVAVDDFGAGFSSLSYLSMLNMDILKIDSSFIQKIPTNKACTIITKSIINLARELNIRLVAEGIETPEQLDNKHRGLKDLIDLLRINSFYEPKKILSNLNLHLEKTLNNEQELINSSCILLKVK